MKHFYFKIHTAVFFISITNYSRVPQYDDEDYAQAFNHQQTFLSAKID
ncbi:hypothetical protein [Flavobacterium sp. 245]|nr:hypothetical protein [Flavobacterium sp. 245]TDP03191.1 hypothetical protein EV145_102354 [Flavobacterium sp. 245]